MTLLSSPYSSSHGIDSLHATSAHASSVVPAPFPYAPRYIDTTMRLIAYDKII